MCVCVCVLNSSVCSYVNAKFIRLRRLHCDCEILAFRCRLVYVFYFLGCCAASVASFFVDVSGQPVGELLSINTAHTSQKI